MQLPQQLVCLKHVVGLSPTTDSCFGTGKPNDANTSLSGQYLSDLLRVKWVDSATDSEIGDVWDILANARDRGIKRVITDYIKLLASRKKERYLPFKGFAGDSVFNLSINAVADFQAIEFVPRESKGAFLVVEGVQLALGNITPPINVDVSIYQSKDGTAPVQIAQTTVNLTAADQFATANFANPVKLDFSDLSEYEKYWFVYQLPAGAQYKNNRLEIGCGCGSKRGRVDKNRFLQFGEWRGVEATAISTLITPRNTTSRAQGLRIKGAASCDFFSWLCDLTTNVNEISTSINSGNQIKLGLTLADLIQLASARFAAEDIANSTNINRITTFQKEHLWGKMKRWEKEYNAGLIWFVDEIPSYVNDCFVCKKDSRISLNSILA